MPRPKRHRIVLSPPVSKGYSPIGKSVDQSQQLLLSLEEYESIRLCDYDMLNHSEACKLMDVSRATFARIYESARRKVAKAFAEGSSILFEGGHYRYEQVWWRCNDCGSLFNQRNQNKEEINCVVCSSLAIERILDMEEASDLCICYNCGTKVPHKAGQPCQQQRCPQCNQSMKKINSNL